MQFRWPAEFPLARKSSTISHSMSTLKLHLSKFQKRPRQTLLIFHILSQTAVDLWTLGPPPFFASLPKLFFFFYRVVFPPAKKTGWPTEIKQSKSCTGRPEVTRAHIYAGQVMRFWFPGETLTFRFFLLRLTNQPSCHPESWKKKGFFPGWLKTFQQTCVAVRVVLHQESKFRCCTKIFADGASFQASNRWIFMIYASWPSWSLFFRFPT